jgi:hypothetical protein
MTPAELLACAARMEEEADNRDQIVGDGAGWVPSGLAIVRQVSADNRLAARALRFAAERGGLEEETDGKQD